VVHVRAAHAHRSRFLHDQQPAGRTADRAREFLDWRDDHQLGRTALALCQPSAPALLMSLLDLPDDTAGLTEIIDKAGDFGSRSACTRVSRLDRPLRGVAPTVRAARGGGKLSAPDSGSLRTRARPAWQRRITAWPPGRSCWRPSWVADAIRLHAPAVSSPALSSGRVVAGVVAQPRRCPPALSPGRLAAPCRRRLCRCRAAPRVRPTSALWGTRAAPPAPPNHQPSAARAVGLAGPP